MGFPLAGAIIGAATSLIGGSMDRSARRADARAASASAMRADAEKAGINPLFWIANGQPAAAGYAPVMGSAIANAGAAIGDGFNYEAQLEMQNAQLQMEKERLETLAQANTLTAQVPGVYGRRSYAQGNRAGGAGSVGSDIDGDGVRVGLTDETTWLDADRPVKREPVTDGPGMTRIENDWTGDVWLPGADGEPWGIDELATGALFGLPQYLLNAAKRDLKYWGGKIRKYKDSVEIPEGFSPTGPYGPEYTDPSQKIRRF